MAKNLIEIKQLKKYFPMPGGFLKPRSFVQAVDDISFGIKKGETLGLVGESGCGKTTCGRTIIKLYEPTSGKIIYDGKDISTFDKKQMLPYRQKIQMIFQDPYACLDPRMMVKDVISEGLKATTSLSKKDVNDKVYQILEKVGLNKEHANRYPHEFSGGQRQRIGVARALIMEPEFVICDEPISALDVSIQAQVVNMLEDLQRELNLTYLFIAHDILMVRHISQRIGVMYLGKLVEIGTSDEIFNNPLHPYTKALLSAAPIPDPIDSKSRSRIVLSGDVPSPIDIPVGCRFKNRCQYAMAQCGEMTPELKTQETEHQVSCFLYQ